MLTGVTELPTVPEDDFPDGGCAHSSPLPLARLPPHSLPPLPSSRHTTNQHHYYMIHVSYCHLLSKSTHRYIKILMYQKLDVPRWPAFEPALLRRAGQPSTGL